MNGTELLTAVDLADRLNLRPSTIRRWARDGRIPAVRVTPKVIRYDLADVVRTVREGQHPRAVAQGHHELHAIDIQPDHPISAP